MAPHPPRHTLRAPANWPSVRSNKVSQRPFEAMGEGMMNTPQSVGRILASVELLALSTPLVRRYGRESSATPREDGWAAASDAATLPVELPGKIARTAPADPLFGIVPADDETLQSDFYKLCLGLFVGGMR
jgi:hypothetical protein